MPRPRPFAQVDVFSASPLRGNPVAVVLDAEGLADEEMALFARWTNLSETTFVLPPTAAGADYRLRIFTPGGELPFAGHPTLGSAHAWLEAGGEPAGEHPVQECGAGLVALRRAGGTLAFAAPPTVCSGPLDGELLTRVVAALGVDTDRVVDHQWVDNGPGWLALLLRSADDVLAIEPDLGALAGLDVGVVGPYPAGADAAFEVRAFAPGVGVGEDPVTGSLNASLAQWLIGSGRAPASYRASQGARLGRAGVIEVDSDQGGNVWIGGATTTRIRGTVTL
ncbi:MAG: PhzF family phenazine biosynthesis protein [Actinomycetales bacterium]|nr:PhzF family phenazine biosynthesis protein [Actinomycetales bacterium]